MYMLMLIEIYTDISITYYNTENMFNADSEYDRLKSSGTLDLIVSQIPESELSELNFIMECLCDHKDDNSCSWNDFVSNVMRLMRNNDGK